jgi:cobalt-zinc-cadmium efflux system outer membrane protein
MKAAHPDFNANSMGTVRRVASSLGLSLLLAAASSTPAPARPVVDPPARLTLAEAVRLATAQAPQVAESAAGVRAAEAAVDIAGLRPNPTLEIEAENLAGTGAYAGGAALETTAAVAVPLELGGKRAARVRVAEAERLAAVIGTDVARADAAMRATRAFVEAAADERRVAVVRERQALAAAALAAARARVRAGKASPIEEQRAEVVRLTADVAVGQAEHQAALARAALARLTGVSPDVVIEATWFDAVDAGDPPAPAGAGPNLPAIAVAEAEVAAADARLDAARRERIPDVTVSAGVRRAAERGDTSAVVGIAVPLPVFNYGRAETVRARAELDRAAARKRALVQELEQALDAARTDVENASASARTASGPALAAAREAARIARIGYEAGKFSQLELIEAERVLADTQEAAITALEALHSARARLARLEGRSEPLFED